MSNTSSPKTPFAASPLAGVLVRGASVLEPARRALALVRACIQRVLMHPTAARWTTSWLWHWCMHVYSACSCTQQPHSGLTCTLLAAAPQRALALPYSLLDERGGRWVCWAVRCSGAPACCCKPVQHHFMSHDSYLCILGHAGRTEAEKAQQLAGWLDAPVDEKQVRPSPRHACGMPCPAAHNDAASCHLSSILLSHLP